MKKLIFLIPVLVLLLISCSADYTRTIIVTSIDYKSTITDGEKCLYTVTWNTSQRFTHSDTFYDECGKFNIGDTLKIIKIKD